MFLPPEVCNLPPERGPCSGFFSRYFYDPTSSSCQMFQYGGCQGNENNFETQDDCMSSCRSRGKKLIVGKQKPYSVFSSPNCY